MRRPLLPVLLLVLVLALAPAAADDGPAPLTEEQGADAVLQAAKAGDVTALADLAAKDDPDPWLVVDILLGGGHRSAAVAFAKAAPRPATARLPDYAASHRDDLDPKRQAAVDVLNTALARGDWKAALAAGDALEPSVRGIPGIRLAFGRGLALREMGRVQDAAKPFLAAAEGALAIGWLSRAAIALHRSARQEDATGEVRAAHELWIRALDIAKRLGDQSLRAVMLNNIGAARLDLGRHADARSAIEEALAIKRRRGDTDGLIRCLINAGSAYDRMGDYAAALTAFEEAHALTKETNAQALRAMILDGLGTLKIVVREPHAALAYYRAALALSKSIGDPPDVMARRLECVGLGLTRTLRFDEAVEHFQRALVIRRERRDARGTAEVLSSLASAYSRMDRVREAAAALDQAVGIQRQVGDRMGAAQSWLQLGALYGEAQDYPKARVALGNAEAILDELPKPNLQMRVHWAFAGVHYGERSWRACLDHCRRAEAIASTLTVGLGEQEASGAADNFAGIFDTALRAATRLPPDERVPELWHYLESGRAYTLREAIQARGALREVLIPEALRRDAEGARAAHARALAALRAAHARGRLAAMRAARKDLEQVQAAQAELLARMQRTAKAGASIAYPRPDPIEAAQARLGDDEALILYGLTERDAVALVVTREDARPVTLARSKSIVAACEALLAHADLVVEPAAVPPLRTLLIEPLKIGPDVRRVLVSPIGILGYVPFALLLPEREVVFVPSATTHGVLHADRALRGEGILGLGDPKYGKQQADAASARMRAHHGGALLPLPETRKEIEAIADVRLLGAEATEANLRKAIATRTRWRAVHLACHGLLDAERPLFSALALTPGPSDDGLLTCADLFDLPVPADLVVLSACDTAKGRLYRTEGIVGLTRAFMFAGAPRVLCSLWKVDDHAARELMVKFHERWRAKAADGRVVTAVAALREAQAYVRNQPRWKHPYYWAAWVLWGLP